MNGLGEDAARAAGLNRTGELAPKEKEDVSAGIVRALDHDLRQLCDKLAAAAPDPIDSPAHYTWHPLGHQLTDIAGHFTFCLGNVLKYVWRAGRKAPNAVEDLKKARWYLDREIARLESGK